MKQATNCSRSIRYLFSLLCFASVGCASTTYRYGIANRRPAANASSAPVLAPMTIAVGGEHPRLDQMENVLHFPAKKIKEWFAKPESVPPIPEEVQRQIAVEKACEYLCLNQMQDVHVEVREYDPVEQWNRLEANQSIAPFWKYTAGTINHLQYKYLPGRVTHRDSFNIYTNTLSINSTRPANALYASATAKYLHSKRFPGAFDAACYLPVVPLYRDYHVGSDLLTYVRVRNEWEFEKEMYPEIYRNFGGDAVSQATSLIPGYAYVPFYVKPALSLGGKIAGNLTGKWIVKTREWEMIPPPEGGSTNNSTNTNGPRE